MLRTRRIVSVTLVLVVVAGSAAAAAASRSTPSPSVRGYGTNNTKYVASATYDVLGRYATDEDYARWAGPLDKGLTHTEFAKSIVKRPERAAIVVTQLYNDAFLRDPDAAGLAYWTAKLTAGYRSANLAAALYASNEFYEGTGGEVVRGGLRGGGVAHRVLLRMGWRPCRASWQKTFRRLFMAI